MSGEKTFLAKLRSPFRSTLDTIEDLSIARQSRGIDSASGSRVSSVYLSDDSSAHGFVVVPEFDDTSASTELENSSSIRSNPTQEFSTPSLDSFSNGHSSYFSDFSRQATTGTSPDIEPGYMLAVEASEIPEADHCHLDQRLGVAYDHIRSLQSPVSPCLRNPASEPGTLRKQLGLPQHSVINHVPSVMPHLPNPHVRPLKSPPSSYYPVPDAETSRPPTPPSCHYNVRSASRFPQSSKPSLHINTNVRSSLDQADIIPKSSRLVHSTKHGSLNVNMPWHLVRNIPAEPASPPSVAVHVASLSPSQCMHKRNATKLVKRKSVNVSTRVSESSLTSSPSIDTRLNEKTSLNSQAPRTGVREQPGAVIIEKEKIIPPIRPPSPLRLDIPTHQLWHNRRTDFEKSFHSPSHYAPTSVPMHPTSPHRVSASTDALASLAWIGASSLGSSTSTPSIPSRHNSIMHMANGEDSHKQLSMAIAVDDHDMSDDVLVEKLEKIRKEGNRCAWTTSVTWRIPNGHQDTPISPTGLGDIHAGYSPDPGGYSIASPISPSFATFIVDADADMDDSSIWQTARKALLCVREIIRTERKYRDALKSLLDGQTLTPPPGSMLELVPSLLQTSDHLLKRFTEDPSAWGVATAFISSEDDLEMAMVSWCTVAGNFFIDRKRNERPNVTASKRIFRRSIPASASENSVLSTKSNGSPSLPSMLTLMSDAGNRIKERQLDDQHWQRSSLDQRSADSHGSSCMDSVDSTHQKREVLAKETKSSRKLSVRDLAIQPTQRVMRYVLLYRDLLESTPVTSPSRALVERALEAASRIAEKCNRAQNNVAFLPRRT